MRGEGGEEQENSAEIRGCAVTKGCSVFWNIKVQFALKMELTLFAPPGPRLHWQVVGTLDARCRARHIDSCRRQRFLRLSAES